MLPPAPALRRHLDSGGMREEGAGRPPPLPPLCQQFPLILYCLHSSAFSRMSCSWSHAAFSDRLRSLSNTHSGLTAHFILSLSSIPLSGCIRVYFLILKIELALAALAQWIECWPEDQRVVGLIPSQGMCLGCGPGPQ